MSTPNNLLLETLDVAEDGWKEASQALEIAVDLQEQVNQLQAELQRTKAASAPSVQPLDPNRVKDTLDVLSRVPGLKLTTSVEKIASQLLADPNGLLDLLVNVTRISSATRSEGRGVTKTAGHNDVAGFHKGVPIKKDPHGFHEVILHGAQ